MENTIQPAELKSIFNQVIAGETDSSTVANLEVCREFFTNPEFRARLEQFTFDQNQGRRNG